MTPKAKKAIKDAPFIVRVLELPTRRKFEVSSELVAEWLRGMPMRDALGAPDPDPEAGAGVADLELYADTSGASAHAFANGTFKGFLTVACSRCGGPVRMELEEELRVTFMPKSEMPSDDEEEAPSKGEGRGKGRAKDTAKDTDSDDGAEVMTDDLDVFGYDGEQIDVEPLLREQFVLAIPYAPLCKEDCKGLCSQCGIDRNSGTCACQKPIDPRLEALKGLKIPS
ncbi:MAG: DUF177 domain-containing protein [Deltaproteobacteria bacterium]|nr:DUF177 domain-containing protein [Deltaproteobacteria bacterium]